MAAALTVLFWRLLRFGPLAPWHQSTANAWRVVSILTLLNACAGPQHATQRPQFAPPLHGVFQDPVPMVVSTEDDLLPTLSANGGLIAYAGKVNGNLDIYVRPQSGGAPVRLTSHSTDDTDPVFSPDGRKIAWVSQADDVKGDVWIMDADGGNKMRLSNRDTADQAPFWAPDGQSVFFTCRSPGQALRRIDVVHLRDRSRRTVVAQGWDGSLSPDGAILFYVHFDGAERPHIVARRLSDGHEVPLTSGPYIEATPHAAAAPEGGMLVVFARFVDDINGDGRLSVDDAPSLWSVSFAPERFAGAPPAEPRPLTPGEGGEIFASVVQDWLVYTAAGRGDLEIFALPLEGIIAAHAPAQAVLEAARRANAPGLRRLALRCLIATHPELAAAAHYELARDLAERSQWTDALTELDHTIAAAGDTELGWLAALEKERIGVLARLNNRLSIRESGEASNNAFVRQVRQTVQQAAAVHPDNARVQIRARLIDAELAYALRQRRAAVEALENLVRTADLPAEDGARALSRLGEFYGHLQDLQAVARVSEELLRRFGQELYYAEAAAQRWVQSAQASASGAPKAALEAIVSSEADLPMVAARAAAALAQLQDDTDQDDVALASWQRIAEVFSSERAVLVQALQAIANLAVEAGHQDTALAAYERLLAEFPENPELRAQARRGITTLALKTAQAQERQGAWEAARQTYRRLLHSNPELVAATRRSIAISAQLGTLDAEMKHYAQAAKNAPRDKFARYAYGYALTLTMPPPLDKAQHEIEAVLALEPRFAAAQLTLGWIRQMREASEPGHGWLEAAAESFETARGLVDRHVDLDLWAAATLNKGNALFALGKLDDAFNAYLERELSGAPFDSPLNHLLFRESFSRVALRNGALDVALDMAYLARKQSAALPGQPRANAIAGLLAALNLQAGRLSDALRFYDDAIARYTDVNDWQHAIPMLRGRALTLRAVGRDIEALATFDRLLGILARGDGPPPAPHGMLMTEIAANPGNVTAAVYGFESMQEEDIAQATAARIFRARVDYDSAKVFDTRHLQLVRALARDARQGPRVRLELLYALNDSALTAAGAGDIDRALALWNEALPMILADQRWAEGAALLQSLHFIWLQHPHHRDAALMNLARAVAQSGLHATRDLQSDSGDNLLAARYARVLALSHLATALAPATAKLTRGADVSFATLLKDLDTRANHLIEAEAAAEHTGDDALRAHLRGFSRLKDANRLLSSDQESGWRAAFDRALWDTQSAQSLIERALEDYGAMPPADTLVPEHSAFVALATDFLLRGHDVERVWRFLEQDRLRTLQPPAERARHDGLIAARQQLRSQRGDAQAYSAALKSSSALVRALEMEPVRLADLRPALEGDSALLQVFAPRADRWDWFIIDQTRLLHVQTPPAPDAMPDTVAAAIGPWPATLYVDAGELLAAPAWALDVHGKPLGTHVAVSEVLSATYLLAAYEARNLARGDVFTADVASSESRPERPAEMLAKTLADVHGRALIHLAVPGRFSGPAEGRSGMTQVVFGPPGNTQREYVDLTTLSNLSLESNLALVDHVPGDSRTARAVCQSLLLAGVPTTWVGDASVETPRLAHQLRQRNLQQRVAQRDTPAAAAMRLCGYRGMDAAGQMEFAAAALMRQVKTGSAAFKLARDTQNPRTWEQARDAFTRLLDTMAFLQQPDNQARLKQSHDPLQLRLPSMLETLVTTNQGVLAEIYLGLKDTSRAISLRQNLLQAQERRGNPKTIYDAQANLARTLSLANRHSEAVPYLQACVELANRQHDDVNAATCETAMAAEYRALYNYGAAEAAYTRAIALQQDKHPPAAVLTRRLLGFLYESSLNNYDLAQAQFQAALDGAEAAGARDIIPRLMLDIARVARTRGDYEQALGWVQQARRLQSQAPPGDRATAALEGAKIYWYRGAYRRARILEEEGLALARQAGDLFQEIQARSLRGLIAMNQGQLGEAESSIGEALSLSRSIGRRAEEAAQLNNLGTVLRAARRLDEAVATFRQALHIDEELGSTEGRAYDLRNLAVAYALQGRYDEGLEAVSQALTLSRSIGNRYNELQCLFAEGDMLDATHRSEAGARYREAEVLAAEISVPEVQWRAAYALARLAEAANDPSSARGLYAKAVEGVEPLTRSSQDAGEPHGRDDLYADALHLAAAEHDSARAFALSSRAHARAVLDVLSSVVDLPGGDTTRALLDAELQSREALTAAARAALRSNDPNAQAAVPAASRNHDASLARLFAQAPRLARALTMTPVPLSVLQQRLPTDTVVVSYLVSSERTLATVITSRNTNTMTLPVQAKALRRDIAALRASMSAFAPVDDALAALCATLVQPLWPHLQDAKSVIFVPHDVLWDVPFAALPTPDANAKTPVVPIWQHMAVALALSEGHLADSLADDSPAPVQKVTAYAPAGDLPFAALEAHTVGDVVYAGSDATVARLADAVPGDAVDLAGHAILDAMDPLSSAVILAPDDEHHDGRLEVRQIFSLPHIPRLVTLSACDSAAVGPAGTGLAWLGLGQAFFVAGANTVIASQNRVSDLATAVLMKRFYRAARTMSPAAALRDAARIVRTTFPHPAHWANFILLGDPR